MKNPGSQRRLYKERIIVPGMQGPIIRMLPSDQELPNQNTVIPVDVKAAPEPDFTSCLQPVAFASRLLGLDTFRATTEVHEDGTTRTTLKRSITASVYSITLLTFIMFLNMRGVIFYADLFLQPYGMLLTYSMSVCIVNVCIATIVGFIVMQLNNDSRHKILEKFVFIDKILLQNAGEYYRKWRRSSRVCLICCYVIITAAICSAEYEHFSTISLIDFIYLLIYLRDYIHMTLVANHVNVVLLIRQRLNILINHLQDLNHKTQITTDTFHLGRLERQENIENCTFFVRTISDCNSTYSESIRNDGPENTKHDSYKENIYLLRTVYNNMGKIINLANSAYGAVVLFCTMTAFIHAVFSIYIGLSVLGSQSTYFDEINSIVMVYVSISWACLYISQAVAIVYSCSATVTAARKTGVLVQDFLLKPGVDKEAQQELKEFLDQVRSTDVAFTGAGFFTLNLALVPSMAGPVISYILVLLQLNYP